jgi:uncharacterized protein
MRKLFLAGFLLIWQLGAFSNNTGFSEGLLWKVSGNGLSEPSYIFGTIHLICPDDFKVFPGTTEHLEKSKLLVLELDLSDPQIMTGVQMGMMMKDGAELKQILDEDDMKMVTAFFADSVGMDINFLARVQPFFLMSMIYPHMIGCFPKSYEDYFIREAKARDIKVEGLETLEEQLHVFDAMSYSEQSEMLMEVLKDYAEKRIEFRKMLDTYLSADLDGLMELFKETETRYEAFNQRLMADRNHRWIERIEKHMHDQPTFFAVGAGHLPGDDGILQLLAKKGYILERIGE